MKPNTPSPFASQTAFGSFLASVASYLFSMGAGDWGLVPDKAGFTDERTGNLRRADGLTIDATTNGYTTKGKIVLSYVRPRDKEKRYVEVYEPVTRDRMASPSIGCADTKTAEQVAADIVRRLLPATEALHAMVLARIAEADGYVLRHNATLLAVAQAAGMADVPRDHYSKAPVFALDVDAPDKGNGHKPTLARVEVRNPDCSHFTLDATDNQAVALVAFLRSPAYLNA